MPSELPSGFKTREEYNEYMRKYNQRYRRRKKTEAAKKQKELLDNFKKIASKVTELQARPDPIAQILSNAHTADIMSTVQGKPVKIENVSGEINRIFEAENKDEQKTKT